MLFIVHSANYAIINLVPVKGSSYTVKSSIRDHSPALLAIDIYQLLARPLPISEILVFHKEFTFGKGLF
jgi:hypothetical protein